MFRKRGIVKLLGVALAVGMFLSACGEKQVEETLVFANEIEESGPVVQREKRPQNSEYDKEETVQIKADATGKVQKITVETKLRKGTEALISDYTILSDLKNTEGDEEYQKATDGKLTWENHGSDISYEGTAKKELPVDVQITYYLDGQEITPKKLAGKSGKLTMRFDYENHTWETVVINGREQQVCIPFSVFSMIMLSEDVFSNVKVENGKVLSLGDEKIAVGYAFPGLAESLKLEEIEQFEDVEIPDYVELTADVTDFELEFTATVLSPGVLEDFDPEDLNDIEELIDDMDELRDASKELVDGTTELHDGVDQFGGYLQDYVDAMVTVKEGAAGLEQGAGALNKNKKALLEGAQGLQAGLEALNTALSGDGSDGSNGGGTADLTVLLTDMNTRLQALESQENLDEEGKAQVAALKQDVAILQSYGAMLQAQTQGIEGLKTSVNELAVGSAKLTEGIQAFNTGIQKLYDGTAKFNEGVGELKDAGKELTDGYQELRDGVWEFQDGVKKFDEEGIQKLADFAGADLQNLVDRLKALKEADDKYYNYGGILPGQSGTVKFVVETEEIKEF